MKQIVVCGDCGGDVVFDVIGVNVYSPSDFQSTDETFEEIFGYLDKQKMKTMLEECYKDLPDRKTVRFFSKCSKCGAENALYIWGVPLV